MVSGRPAKVPSPTMDARTHKAAITHTVQHLGFVKLLIQQKVEIFKDQLHLFIICNSNHSMCASFRFWPSESPGVYTSDNILHHKHVENVKDTLCNFSFPSRNR